MRASRCDGVSYVECSLLYENCCDRTFSFIQLCLDHKTSCRAVRVSLKLHHFRCQEDHLKQLRDPFFCVRGHGDKDRASAPVFRDQLILCQLLFHALDIRAGLIDLVDRHDDLDPCRFRVVDRLHGLRHHAVVRSHYEDRDIRGVCTAHTHCGERLMSRRIQESDLLSIDFHHISADMLSDAACLAVSYVGVADRIQERGLAVVDMAHDTDDRRTFHHSAFVFLILF